MKMPNDTHGIPMGPVKAKQAPDSKDPRGTPDPAKTKNPKATLRENAPNAIEAVGGPMEPK